VRSAALCSIVSRRERSCVRVVPPLAERAIRAAQRAARGAIGSLRVGFTGSAPFNPIATGAIRSFKRAYPEVDSSLKESNIARLIGGLPENLFDTVFSALGLPGR
jgi:DNA-binding transcriptional LysR family regulator